MFARSAKLAVLLLSTAFISCSQQDDILTEGATDGTEITTTVSVNVPDVFKSRTVPDEVYQYGTDTDKVYKYIGESGMPSIGNLDLKEHPLSFTVGIYVAKTVDGETTYTLVDQQEQKNVSDDKADFNFHLIKGLPYYIVAYADFNNDENTHLQLNKIPVTNELNPELNNELKDAFFANQTFTADYKINVVLKRPFGKLRLLAHDFNTFAAGGVNKITNVEVIYNKPPMLGSTLFNAITGKFDSEAKADGDVSRNASPVSYALEYNEDGTADYTAVFTTYLPVNLGTSPDPIDYNPVEEGTPVPQSWMFPFDVIVTYTDANGNTRTRKRNFQFEIPVKRNWLTTVDIDNFWTDNSQITVSIDHRFEGFIDYPTGEEKVVNTANQLQEAINEITANATNDDWYSGKIFKIALGDDINADENTVIKQPGGFVINAKAIRIALDLKGHTIYASGKNTPMYTTKVKDKAGNYVDQDANVGGIFGILNWQNELYINDSSEDASGKIVCNGGVVGYEGLIYSYPLIRCFNGGLAVINGGTYINNSNSEVIYVYEQAGHRIKVENAFFKQNPDFKTKTTLTDSEKATFRKYQEKFTAKVIINGGWFENLQPSSTSESQKVTINSYNLYKEDDWNKWKDYFYKNKYPEWTKWEEQWGPWPTSGGRTFGYVYLNGGSYVEFDPSTGDNVSGNRPNEWVDPAKFTVLKETINEKTVYTVVPKDSPHKYTKI